MKSKWTKTFRHDVGQSKNARYAVAMLRSKITSASHTEVFEALGKNAVFRSAVAFHSMPRSFGDLGVYDRLQAEDLIFELRWLAETLGLFSDQVQTFVALEKRFDDAYILGNWSMCLGVLNEIEEALGLSVWLISRRLTVLKLAGETSGFDYADELIGSASEGSPLGWLVYMLSYRADPNVTSSNFVRTIERALKNSRVHDDVADFFRYHALSERPHSRAQCVNVISRSETSALIDRYIAIIDALQFVSIDVSEEKERETIVRIASRLNDHIPDDRTGMILDLLDRSRREALLDRIATGAADEYTKGDYASAAELLAEQVAESPSQTSILTLLARANLRSNLASELPENVQRLVDNISAVHSFSDGDQSASALLLREQLSGTHRPLSITVKSLFSGLVDGPSDNGIELICEALNSVRLTPLQIRVLSENGLPDILDQALYASPSSLALKLQKEVSQFGAAEFAVDVKEQLPDDRALLYDARALCRLGRHADAIDILIGLEEHEVNIVAYDALRELYKAYSDSGRTRETLKLIARSYRRNQKLHSLFRIRPFLRELETSSSGLPFDEIALSIAYLICDLHTNDDYSGPLGDAAEEYALSKGGELPSKLAFAEDDPDWELFRVYLEQVCSPAIIDKFVGIANVKDAETERLEICRILSELYPDRRQDYLDEIREITRRRVVRDRFQQVERTKIYIDTEGLKRQAEKTTKDNYLRFLDASSRPEDSSHRIEMVKRVQSLLSEVEADGVKLHIIDLPANERDRLFDNLVSDIMRMLISSQEYGLEAYLSTRVRHGTMGNQLRSSFERQGLLSQRDSDGYKTNFDWPDRLSLPASSGDWLAGRLAEYSERFDHAIEDLVRQKVQVNSEEHPSGLFVFKAFNFDTMRLQSEITSDTSFDTFMDKVIDQFWPVLEQTLAQVRGYIKKDFGDVISDLIDSLEKDVSQTLQAQNISLLRDAIAAARTQMQVNIANVANWFTLSRDMERPDYEFGVAVEVATESIRACHPSLNLHLFRNDDVSFECKGKTLESLVYLLFTALDNAVEHCRLSDEAPSLSLSTDVEGEYLELELVNSCAPMKNYKKENQRIEKLVSDLEQGDDVIELAAQEGGSGYPKMMRILRHDLMAGHTLSAGYQSPTEYYVRVLMDRRAIIK